MHSAEVINRAKKKANRTKHGIGSYLPGANAHRRCDCKRCWPQGLTQTKRTIRDHRELHGVHPEAHLRSRAATQPLISRPQPPSPSRLTPSSSFPQTSPHRPRSSSPMVLDATMPPGDMYPRAGSQSQSRSRSRSSSRPLSPSTSWYPEFTGCCPSGGMSPGPSSRLPNATPHANLFSDEANPQLLSGDAQADVTLFGKELANWSISGANGLSEPLFIDQDQDKDEEDWDEDEDGGDDDDDDSSSDEGGGSGPDGEGGEPANPDDPNGAQAEGPQIQVPPDDPGGVPGDPDNRDPRLDIPALEEAPVLRNIYLRTWVLYAFHGATQHIIRAVLESHKFALLAGAEFYPADFIDEVRNMPTTLCSLERRLGMDFSDLITVYPVCPDCGKRYTMEELHALHDPQCTHGVAAGQCPGILYNETRLADGTQKRNPIKSFPYNSLPRALGRLFSRVGIADFAQHWRRYPNDAELNDPPEPQDPQDWFDRMGPNTRFGDISRGWGWHSQATGIRRRLGEDGYGDEPTGDVPLSLACAPLGLNLGLNLDGFQAFKGKFAAAGSYSANGVYIIVNNLPFYQRNLIENMLLALVIPGPHEPKGYAFEQMLEPLIDDLVELANGMMLPVYNSETGEVEQRLVYANLSALIVDWIARIKCIGHVGVTAEHNHCPYCKIRQCLLGSVHGYQSIEYDLRDPDEHLQHKHRWLDAPEGQREGIRTRTGTYFTEFDRLPGFFSFENTPIDAMHLLDLGATANIVRKIIFKQGMLRKRFHEQEEENTPEERFNAFIARTVFPHHCSRLPTQIGRMNKRAKAEQWRLLRLLLPVAFFEAWRIGDTIPEGNVPRGGVNTKHFEAQKKNAKNLHKRRLRAHRMDNLPHADRPRRQHCMPSRNPRDYYANILRFCLGSAYLTQHQVTLSEIAQGGDFLEQVGVGLTEMNVHLVQSFHAMTHLPDHIRKYGNVYNTLTARFERANRLLGNVNTNGHGRGVLETTMAKGFLRRTECYRYVNELQSIDEPSVDDTRTTEVLLGAMRNGPEHEFQRGMLDAILAGEAPMRGQEETRLATTSAQVNFRDDKHRAYYGPMVRFCNQHRPPAIQDVVFYGFGMPPNEGAAQIHISSTESTRTYPHFHRHGIRYGSANHYRGLKSRYGYVFGRIPVLIQGIYETVVVVRGQEYKFQAVMLQRFVAPDPQPEFPWSHWNDTFGIDAWMYEELAPLEEMSLDVFTGVFALSDLVMPNGHFWITIAMINTTPEDRVGGDEEGDSDDDNDD